MMKPSVFEPALKDEQVMLYLPQQGTDVIGCGIGPEWTRDSVAGGTVSHPAPTNSFTGQWRRTRITSTAASNNELGVHQPVVCAWRGDAASRGGFYFEAKFMVNAMVDTDIRLFCGLSAQVSAGVCISNTVPDNTVGLWCDDTDAANLTIVTKGTGGSATKTALASVHALTAGVLYRFRMLCNPNQTIIVTQLENHGTGAVIGTQNVGSTMPTSTVFMAPQVGFSNATNNAGGDCSFDVISCYLRTNLRLTPLGTP